jgi:glycine cleavage system transcriptional repressor
LINGWFWGKLRVKLELMPKKGELMSKIIVTIVGRDRPGLVHLVSKVLATHGGNIEEINQTTLKGQFAGLFSFNAPDRLDEGLLDRSLADALEGTGLAYWIAPPAADEVVVSGAAMEPYVITLQGQSRADLIPGITQTVASFDVNIDNLRAVTLSGETQPAPQVLVLEISVPATVQQNVFRQALSLTAEELGIEINLQHRDIFEALHRL